MQARLRHHLQKSTLRHPRPSAPLLSWFHRRLDSSTQAQRSHESTAHKACMGGRGHISLHPHRVLRLGVNQHPALSRKSSAPRRHPRGVPPQSKRLQRHLTQTAWAQRMQRTHAVPFPPLACTCAAAAALAAREAARPEPGQEMSLSYDQALAGPEPGQCPTPCPCRRQHQHQLSCPQLPSVEWHAVRPES